MAADASASHMSGPLILTTSGITPSSLGSGVYIPVRLDKLGGTLAAASGTILEAWRITLPNRATVLRELGTTFARGASAPQGGVFRYKMWSGSTSKGLASKSVAGASAPSLSMTGLSATFPANSVLGLAVHTVGATSAGGGARPTLYMSYS